MATWILDASHGGEDNGAVSKNLKRLESEIVLEAVLEAQRHLIRNGEKVILTRENNDNISLNNRIKFVNSVHADYFISFNMNYDNDESKKGVKVTYTISTNKSEQLARLIKNEIFSEFRTNDLGIHEELNLYKDLKVQSIIIYADYISNLDVEKNFDSKKYGELVAKACLGLVDKVLLKTPITMPKKTQKRYYRICIGNCGSFIEAIKFVNDLKEQGLDNVYIVPYEGR